MSNFEFLKGINSGLYKVCLEAERAVNTQPRTAAVCIRQSLESFTFDALEMRRIDSRNMDLFSRIRCLNENRILPKDLTDKMHDIRKVLNENVHFYDSEKNNNNKETSSKISTSKLVSYLNIIFDATMHYYCKFNKIKKYNFDINRIPIGDYEIIEELPKKSTEIVCSNKYRAVKVNPNTGTKQHAIIRKYNPNFVEGFEVEFKLRDSLVLEARWKEDPTPANIVRYNDIPGNESENLYIAFFIPEDAEPLSEIQLETLSVSEKLDVSYAISNGIYELHSLDTPIAHRMLNPDSVYVFKHKEQYNAKICNFEYAKLFQNEVGTVLYFVRKVTGKYKAPELFEGIENTCKDYRPADIYSIGKIMIELFGCQKKNDEEQEEQQDNNCHILRSDEVSDELNSMIQKMVSYNPNERPNIEDVIKLLNKERAAYNE